MDKWIADLFDDSLIVDRPPSSQAPLCSKFFCSSSLNSWDPMWFNFQTPESAGNVEICLELLFPARYGSFMRAPTEKPLWLLLAPFPYRLLETALVGFRLIQVILPRQQVARKARENPIVREPCRRIGLVWLLLLNLLCELPWLHGCWSRIIKLEVGEEEKRRWDA